MKNYSLIFSLVIFGTINPVYTASFANVSSLYDDLISRSYKYIRPETDLNTATSVGFKFYLTNLQDLDENTGLFSVAGFFNVNWRDNNLIWNRNSYGGGDTKMKIPTKHIWTPHLILGNPYKEGVVISLEDSTVSLYEDGDATWSPADNFQMACDADVSYFPYDSQTCQMMVIPWQYDANEIRILIQSNTVDTTYYSENPQWDYVSSTLYNGSSVNALYISMTFKRKPTFFMINVIFPIILLGILNLFVFALPADSGERVGFSITLLLSIAVFMTIVADSLPSTSSPRLSSVGIKLVVDLTISSLIVVCTILGLVIHHRDDAKPVTSMWRRLVKACRPCKKRQNNGIQVGHAEGVKDTEKLGIPNDDKDDVSWKDVSRFLDKCFIVIFSVVLFLANLSFFMDIVAGVN
ncbi:neuronal acetylcholine receptor subunit alpha-5-like [Mytilus trossulus]|uniref:neuronal acetylcholine receptor subunit alpha-5-like n=1 Tax=Mytilus trossulus TaxID=6551 RepID=UPI00300462A2